MGYYSVPTSLETRHGDYTRHGQAANLVAVPKTTGDLQVRGVIRTMGTADLQKETIIAKLRGASPTPSLRCAAFQNDGAGATRYSICCWDDDQVETGCLKGLECLLRVIQQRVTVLRTWAW